MPKSLIGLGANLEHREKVLRDVVRQLEKLPHVNIVGLSRVYETTPVGGPDGQSVFLNAAVLIESNFKSPDLLTELHKLETAFGRTRDTRWGPRVLDLDLLLHDDVVSDSPKLTLPHPRMTFRRFVLHPACDVAADMIHPATGHTLGQLLNHLNQTPNHIVLSGGSAAERTAIMKDVKRKITPHGIELHRKSEKNIPKCPESGMWLMSDLPEDIDRLDSEIVSNINLPKLHVSLERLRRKDAESQTSQHSAFAGPHLDLAHSGGPQVAAVDEVVAAILAMSFLPTPVKNVSLQGP